MSTWPDYMRKSYGSPADFRKLKRKEVRAAERAAHDLLIGCAFTPAGRNIVIALEALRAARKELGVKNFKKMI